jgi:hypothetical protein
MHHLKYGTKDIYFELKRSDRKTLAIEVHPDSSIVVVAPENSTIKDIENKITKRGLWISKQQNYFEQFLPRTPERQYVSGETHYYLGKSYLLKISEGNNNSVKLIAGKLQVICRQNTSPETVKKILAHWYYEHAEKRFESVVDNAFEKFKEYKINKPKIEIKRMSKRWGSCNTIDKITINPEIIKAPTKCIEYLIIHEMCHLIIPNHKKQFFDLLEQKMPNWKKWKLRLEKSMK